MKFYSRLMNACVLLIVLLQSATLAQRTNDLSGYWLLQSQIVTDQLIKDASELPPVERALLWARLGDAWWQADPTRAHQWVQKAVEIVESSPASESPADLRRRLAVARSLLSLIAPRDQKLAARITSLLTSNAEHGADTERGANADALVRAALAVLETDPKRATELGMASLRAGHPTMLAFLLWELRVRDSPLDDALFREAMAVVRATQDLDLLNALKRVAFPELDGPVEDPKLLLPDTIRGELLRVFAESLQKAFSSANRVEVFCSSSGPLIMMAGSLLPQFDRLLPLQAGGVRQFVTGCQSRLHPLVRMEIDNLRGNASLSVEDLLKAAADANDFQVKAVYQLRAGELAVRKKSFDRAVSILDSMDNDGHKFLSGIWQGYRWEWAAYAAFEHFQRQDLTGMQEIINAVPANLRPLTQMRLANNLSDKKYSTSYRSLAVELIIDAHKGLMRADISEAERAESYLFLLRLYTTFIPADAITILKEAVASLNRIEKSNATADENSDDAPAGVLGQTWPSEYFSLPRLRADDYAVLEAISAIESPIKRIQARFGILKISLERYRTAVAAKTEALITTMVVGKKYAIS
jgi:hypothetical protein